MSDFQDTAKVIDYASIMEQLETELADKVSDVDSIGPDYLIDSLQTILHSMSKFLGFRCCEIALIKDPNNTLITPGKMGDLFGGTRFLQWITGVNYEQEYLDYVKNMFADLKEIRAGRLPGPPVGLFTGDLEYTYCLNDESYMLQLESKGILPEGTFHRSKNTFEVGIKPKNPNLTFDEYFYQLHIGLFRFVQGVREPIGMISLDSPIDIDYHLPPPEEKMKRVLRIAGKVDGIIKFAIFGNELYRRNEALRQAYADLEETGRQRDELQNERVALLSSAAYGDFASTIAHELRSPLTVVVDRLKKMQRRLERGKAIPPQDLESALHGAGMIAQQLNQMEDYAQQRDEMASYDVNPFVIKMARYYDFKLRKAGFEFHFYDREGNSVIDEQGNPLPDATSQVAMVNPALFNFVLKNLFENAFQFARPDSRRIDIRTYECDDRIYFEFKDYGTGIPEDIQQRVFEPRFTTRDEPGIHGMGLSTVKSNIERMNGQISLESRLGEYTTFTISFEKAKTY